MGNPVKRVMLAAGLALTTMLAGSVSARVGQTSSVLVELVNFECPHCRAESAYVPGIASAARQAGNTFEVAPLEPAPAGSPAASVLAFYAETAAYPEQDVAAAAAIYNGYVQGAAMGSKRSVLSWLHLQGVRVAAAYRLLSTQIPMSRWTKALRLAGYVHASTYPTFVAIDASTGDIRRVFRWNGHAGQLARTVIAWLSMPERVTKTEVQ